MLTNTQSHSVKQWEMIRRDCAQVILIFAWFGSKLCCACASINILRGVRGSVYVAAFFERQQCLYTLVDTALR